MKVLIAGGGIGGLTTALACLQAGHDVSVFERSDTIKAVGAGIQVPPNAMRVLQKLCVSDAISRTAVQPDFIEARMGQSGRQIFTIPLASSAVARWGAPYLHIHRADYIAALTDAVTTHTADALHVGEGIDRYEQTEAAVTAHLSSGRQVTGDVLVGADGIHSTIREQMLGRDTARFTGNVAWRVVVPMDRLGADAPRKTACAWMGKGRHAVTYQLRGGTLANFVGVVECDTWDSESWTQTGEKRDALADFEGWHPTLTHVIKSADADSFYRWALHDRPSLPRWVDGRVALLGDAAHPMLPFLAQGAAMAVEDAWALAQALEQPNGLQAYQDTRLPRTAKVQAASRANMKTFHKRTRLAQLATYGPMWGAGLLLPSVVHRRMDWLYGFDITTQA